MMTEILITIFKTLLDFMVSLLPNMPTIDPNISEGIDNLSGYWWSWNEILPIDTTITLFAVYLTIEGAIFFFHFDDWIYKKVRG
jgi:hypothetical protein